jgi:ubiquinone/menaquinone biosynthesis C-methylase UbiE
MKKILTKELEHLHEDVPANYYDHAISKNSLQRFWHTKRFSEVDKYLTGIKASRILDIGCHGGTFTNRIQRKFKNRKIYGIDISRNAIAYAQKKYQKIDFLVAKAEKLPFKDKSFDFVTCFEVLEHVERPDKVIREILRVLKDDGNFLVIVPTENLLFRTIWAVWTKLGPGRIWKHTHIQKFSNHNLDLILEHSGFRILKRNTFLLGMLLIVYAIKE